MPRKPSKLSWQQTIVYWRRDLLNQERSSGKKSQVPDVIFEPMLVNLFLMTLPRVGIVATSAKAIAEAIKEYSIAVAPDSSFIKPGILFISFSNFSIFGQLIHDGHDHSVLVPTTKDKLEAINTC
jgi:hypothetical protein